MQDPSSIKEARSKLLRWLGYRQRSIQEAQLYLEKKGFSAPVIEAVIAEMLNYGYLDDERFAGEMMESYYQRGYGPRRVCQVLRHKGIDLKIIERLLPQYFTPENELALCREALEKKVGRAPGEADRQWLRRQSAFLARRGFHSAVILKVLQDYGLAEL
ncbi:MAG: regulatory protein RecX [Firmicutes bacterium]|jgi:regulatory protein|nr:regulatory protein RecX [Bacillota bacterium]